MRRVSGFRHFCCFSHQLKPCPQRLLGVITRPSGRASLLISGFAGGLSSPHAVRESVKDASNIEYIKVFISCSLTCVSLARFSCLPRNMPQKQRIWFNRRLFYQGIPFRATKAGEAGILSLRGSFLFQKQNSCRLTLSESGSRASFAADPLQQTKNSRIPEKQSKITGLSPETALLFRKQPCYSGIPDQERMPCEHCRT